MKPDYSLNNSFPGIFHYRESRAWFCFADEFNGLRHEMGRHFHVSHGMRDQ